MGGMDVVIINVLGLVLSVGCLVFVLFVFNVNVDGIKISRSFVDIILFVI